MFRVLSLLALVSGFQFSSLAKADTDFSPKHFVCVSVFPISAAQMQMHFLAEDRVRLEIPGEDFDLNLELAVDQPLLPQTLVYESDEWNSRKLFVPFDLLTEGSKRAQIPVKFGRAGENRYDCYLP
ncbi:MAG: hypothetical protein ABL927_11650 [Bdellovibrionales bacterium]